jgi:hypothetical protein
MLPVGPQKGAARVRAGCVLILLSSQAPRHEKVIIPSADCKEEKPVPRPGNKFIYGPHTRRTAPSGHRDGPDSLAEVIHEAIRADGPFT